MVFKLLKKLISSKEGGMKRTEEKGSDSMGCLCEDVLLKVLILVPLKPLTRLKCVSKQWCALVNNILQNQNGLSAKSHSLVFSSCSQVSIFVFHGKDRARVKQINLFQISGCCPSSCCPSGCFHSLEDSQKGLLLYRKSIRCDTQLMVCNPSLDNKNQCLNLPRIDVNGKFQFVQSRFLYDGSKSKFKVISFATDFETIPSRNMEYHVFSSDKCNWVQHRAKIHKPSRLEFGFHSRKLYWPYVGFVLIHDIDKQFFSVLKLPILPCQKDFKDFHGLLWESEGCLHYYQSTAGRFFLWTYGHGYRKWSLKEEKCYKDIDGGENINDGWGNSSTYLHPVAFIEESQMLYSHLQGAIYSFSFETRRFVMVTSNYLSNTVLGALQFQ